MNRLIDIKKPKGIVQAYLLIGCLWILLSDFILFSILPSGSEWVETLEQLKGLLYVLLSGLFFYLLLRRSYQKVYERQADLDLLFKSKDIGLMKIDRDAVIVDVSKNLAGILGYTRKELIGKPLAEITVPEDSVLDEVIMKDLKDGKINSYHFEKRYLHKKDDTPIWMEVNGTVKWDGDEVESYVAAIQNVMPLHEGRRTVEKEIREKRALINSTNDLVWSVDHDYKLVSFNDAYEGLILLKTGQRIAKNDLATIDLKVNDQKSHRWEYYYSRVLKGESFSMIEKLDKQGKTCYIEVTFNPIFDQKNQLVGVSCFGRDISSLIATRDKLKKALDEVEKNNHFIQTSLNNLPIGIAVNRISEGQVTLVNKKFCEIYGWPAEDLTDIDSFFSNVYPDPVYRDEMRSQIMSDIESGDAERMQWESVRITTKDGEERLVNAKNIMVHDHDLMISTVIDTTERMKHIQTINERNKELKEIAWMQSHEVRNPLSNIMALTEMIRREYAGEISDDKVFSYLGKATDELDAIIRNITSRTEKVLDQEGSE